MNRNLIGDRHIVARVPRVSGDEPGDVFSVARVGFEFPA